MKIQKVIKQAVKLKKEINVNAMNSQRVSTDYVRDINLNYWKIV